MITEKHKELARLMSDISEDCWFAGWMGGLEFSLWQIMQNPDDRMHGMALASIEDIERLRALSDEIGAWPAWCNDLGPDDAIDGLYLKWVPLDEWRRTYEMMTNNPGE